MVTTTNMTPAEIRAAREALGMSVADLADLMEMHPSGLHRIESGARPPPVRFVALLRALIETQKRPTADTAFNAVKYETANWLRIGQEASDALAKQMGIEPLTQPSLDPAPR